jgi:tetratricopeptide (TPR) repeat protein
MNKLLSWLNRERIALVAGALLLIFGAQIAWYRLTPEVLVAFSTNLVIASVGRLVAALFAVLGLICAIGLGVKRTPRLLFWGGLSFALLFPFILTTWLPPISFIASAYHQQAEQVSRSLDKSSSDVQASWKQNIKLDRSEPPISTFAFAIKDSKFFQPASWDAFVINGLGYDAGLLQFIGLSWFFSVMGLGVSLLAIYLAFGDQARNVFLQDIGKVFPWFGLLLAAIICFLITVNLANYQLDLLFAKGEYNQVMTASHDLIAWYPPLSGDIKFIKRLAAAGFLSGNVEPDLTSLVAGIERYKSRDFAGAEDYFRQALTMQPKNFLARGYLAAAIVNQGVNYFNDASARKPAAAADRFEEALSIFPGHVEALYDLMIARVVNGEFNLSAEAAQRLIAGQQYFQQPKIGLLGQAFLHLTWAKFHAGEVDQAWTQYRKSVGEGWKDSSPESQSSEVKE